MIRLRHHARQPPGGTAMARHARCASCTSPISKPPPSERTRRARSRIGLRQKPGPDRPDGGLRPERARSGDGGHGLRGSARSHSPPAVRRAPRSIRDRRRRGPAVRVGPCGDRRPMPRRPVGAGRAAAGGDAWNHGALPRPRARAQRGEAGADILRRRRAPITASSSRTRPTSSPRCPSTSTSFSPGIPTGARWSCPFSGRRRPRSGSRAATREGSTTMAGRRCTSPVASEWNGSSRFPSASSARPRSASST